MAWEIREVYDLDYDKMLMVHFLKFGYFVFGEMHTMKKKIWEK